MGSPNEPGPPRASDGTGSANGSNGAHEWSRQRGPAVGRGAAVAAGAASRPRPSDGPRAGAAAGHSPAPARPPTPTPGSTASSRVGPRRDRRRPPPARQHRSASRIRRNRPAASSAPRAVGPKATPASCRTCRGPRRARPASQRSGPRWNRRLVRVPLPPGPRPPVGRRGRYAPACRSAASIRGAS